MTTTSNYEKHTNKNPVQRLLIQNYYRTMFDILSTINFRSVLDVGCGEGFTLSRLQEKKLGREYEGIDYSHEALRIGRDLYPNIKFRKGDIYSLPYTDSSFDLVVCTEVLEHLDNPATALQELCRISKKYCLISVPNEPWFQIVNFLRGKYMKSWGNHPEHINHWSHTGIQSFITKAGFNVINRKFPFAWTLVLAQV